MLEITKKKIEDIYLQKKNCEKVLSVYVLAFILWVAREIGISKSNITVYQVLFIQTEQPIQKMLPYNIYSTMASEQ